MRVSRDRGEIWRLHSQDTKDGTHHVIMRFSDVGGECALIYEGLPASFSSTLSGSVQERWRLTMARLALGLALKDVSKSLAGVKVGVLGDEVILEIAATRIVRTTRRHGTGEYCLANSTKKCQILGQERN